MIIFKILFFLILSVAIPFFFGFAAHALKAATVRLGKPEGTDSGTSPLPSGPNPGP